MPNSLTCPVLLTTFRSIRIVKRNGFQENQKRPTAKRNNVVGEVWVEDVLVLVRGGGGGWGGGGWRVDRTCVSGKVKTKETRRRTVLIEVGVGGPELKKERQNTEAQP